MQERLIKGYNLRILSRSELNTTKWDNCVKLSVNESPMAYSWVLDILFPGWSGVVIGDYLAVMPLTIDKRLYGTFLLMPFDIQNFGIFSSQKQVTELFPDILKSITKPSNSISTGAMICPRWWSIHRYFLPNTDIIQPTLENRRQTVRIEYGPIDGGYADLSIRSLRKKRLFHFRNSFKK